MGTHYTHLVHRIRLRPIKPQFVVNDLEEVDPSKFEIDPNIEQHEKEPFSLDAFIETSLEISTESDKKQVQFDNRPSETIYQAAEPPNSVRTVNNIPSSNDEFLVEGHVTSEQTYTAQIVIDTSQYNFGQKEDSQPTHNRYNFRSGDRMMAVREQCAAHLSSLREPIIDRQQGKIANSKTHIVHWVTMHAATVTELTQDLYTKHPELHCQANRQNTCVGQTCLYFDEEENRWIFSTIISDKYEKIQQRNIISCLEDLQFRAQQLALRELAIERLPKGFGNIGTKEFESMIEITFLRTDIAIIIYDKNPVEITQIADLQTSLDDDNLL